MFYVRFVIINTILALWNQGKYQQQIFIRIGFHRGEKRLNFVNRRKNDKNI